MARVHAGRLEALPRDRPVLLDVAGRRLALVRRGDTVHALDDRCPHAGGPLSEGALEGEALICPYHAWFWNVQTGVCMVPGRGARVTVYPVTIDAGEVWVEVG